MAPAPVPRRRIRLRAEPSILYYACGGGLGHVTRAAAILRQLRRLGIDNVLAVTNAMHPRPLTHERLSFIHLPARDPVALAIQARATVRENIPQVLVVDAFPGGVTGELTDMLPALPCRKVLVFRHLRAPYQQQVIDEAVHFDLLLCAEVPPVTTAVPQVLCEPVLIRDVDELLSREAARQRMGIEDDQPVVLGVSSGDPEWEGQFFPLLEKIWRRRMPHAHLRLASPRRGEGSEPLLERFNGIDLVIGASGYNLFHEAQACGIPAIYLPQPRRFDDQHWRARNARIAETPQALEALVITHLAALPRRRSADYRNGAIIAARTIAALMPAG
jgi:hypothetical protein